MAKEPNIDIFSRTEPSDNQAPDLGDLEAGIVKPQGVGLKQGTISALDLIAGQYKISRNALMKLAIRRFILDYRAGKINLSEFIEIPPEPKRNIILPK